MVPRRGRLPGKAGASVERLKHPIENQLGIEHDDDRGHRPADNFDPGRIGEFPHLRPVTGEAHQRPDREAELQAQRDLANARNNELQAILAYRRALVEFERVQQTGSAGNITVLSR